MKLFPREKVVGIFRGFSEGGLEFHADLVLPYKRDFQSTPMHGQFVLVQLESEAEAVLGRITSLSSEGRLASGSGEDYGIRAVSDDREIPEDLREQYLKYRVDIRVLGVLRLASDQLHFAASHRRLPHVGSHVAFLADDILREVAGHNVEGAEVGFLAFGEFIHADDDPRLVRESWMQVRAPKVIARFPVSQLVSRRSFVFARAGFGKSNLIKLVFSSLYSTTPQVEKRGGRQVPVGTVIFDPDGEYFWPDDKNRPGLCDVPTLQDKVVVFTSREAPSPFYQSFVVSGIKLDIRRLRPADVISIALAAERQDQQNVRKLKSMNDTDWASLVNEVYRARNEADPDLIKSLLKLGDEQEAEMLAARANMTQVVQMLHDPGSQMLDILLAALRAGKLCVVDVSQMRGTPAFVLSGLILRRIFDHNQLEFTRARPETIPTIAVVEEAQSVLGHARGGDEGPYVTWVKEGRKYDLGAVLITQQPGSIAPELLSQGDNWFIFHLLSSGDLHALKSANAHFSDDLLSSLLNEPLVGQGIFWSSAGGKSYPLPIRALSFEATYKALDPEYNKAEASTYAKKLRGEFDQMLVRVQREAEPVPAERVLVTAGSGTAEVENEASVDEPVDFLETCARAAIAGLKQEKKLLDDIRTRGTPWMGVQAALTKSLPTQLDNRAEIAYRLVVRAMTELFGPQNEKWRTEKRPSKSKSNTTTTYVVLI